jgi:hypothetical protein
MTPILTIELVPRSSWCDNVRSQVSRSEWDRLRKLVYAEYQHRCGICKAKGRLAAHEIWEYNDETAQQTLKGMIALCDLCHHIKHLGLAEILASQGKLNLESFISHYCRVNRCSVQDFVEHRESAFEQWIKRSAHPWKVDVSALERYAPPDGD